jgi:mannose/fructose/N-acetylgalactosamine-specific phosphotransferase system component IID
MVQELRSLEIEGGVNFGQIKLSGQIWTLKPLIKEIWSKSEHKDPRQFYNLSNDG